MAEKALEDLLDRKLGVSAAWINEKESVRHTVARFSMDLSQRTKDREQALVQAMRGDIRLAQALANRTGSGVTQLLDLTRDARSLSNYLGLHFLSMRFFREKQQNAGSVVITTGPESQQLLFDELDKQGGAFWHSEGYKRRTVVSLKSLDGQLVDADFNLHIQIREKAKYASGSAITDHVDPLIALFLGKQDLYDRLNPAVLGLKKYIQNKCQEPWDEQDWSAKQAYEKCMKDLPNDPKIAADRAKAEALLATIISEGIKDGMDPDFDVAEKFVKDLFALKLALQTNPDLGTDSSTSTKSDMVFDYRLTEKAVSSLLAAPDGADRFLNSLHDVLALLDSAYNGPIPENTGNTWNSWDNDTDQPKPAKEVLQDILKRLRPEFEKRARRYQRYANLGGVSYQSKAMGFTTLGNKAHLLVVKGTDDGTLSTVAEGKASATARFFDKMVEKLKWTSDFFETAHQVIGYSLLNVNHPSELELLVNFDYDSKYPDVKLHGQGLKAKLIDAGQYDLDSLVTGN
jgi:hypothetical protein